MEWWVLIPLAAIAVGAFSEWLKFREKQERLGVSTDEMEDELEALRTALAESEAQRAALDRRIQNLETIVTSETWDALLAGRGTEGIEVDARVEQPEATQVPAEQAERLARRIRK